MVTGNAFADLFGKCRMAAVEPDCEGVRVRASRPSPGVFAPDHTMKAVRFVAAYFLRHKAHFSFMLLLAITGTLFGVAIPKVVGGVIEDVFHLKKESAIVPGIALILMCLFLREFLNWARVCVNNTLEQKVLVELRRDLHDRLLALQVSYYDTRRAGDIAGRVTEEVQNVERAVIDGTEQGLLAGITLVAMMVVMLWMQPLLAALVLIAPALMIAYDRWYFKKKSGLWKEVREANGDMNAQLIEDIQGIRLIHGFGLRRARAAMFQMKSALLSRRILRGMFLYAFYGPTGTFMNHAGLYMVVGVGGWMFIHDRITFGAFFTFYMYAQMMLDPLTRLKNLSDIVAGAKASGDRVLEILEHPLDIADPKHPKSFPPGSQEVRYESVKFGYAGRDAVLEDFNLTLPKGTVTALVGQTGAGKSTVTSLLLRYYDATGGSVTVGGIDVREFTLDDLRAHIGYVPQDPFLFDGTVEDNLRVAKVDATDDEIRAALEGARALEFVERMPDGVRTSIGERGVRLSQGEKQRLTIARVMLKNPRLLILDEATASVDTVTERKIQEAVDNLTKDRTTIVIANRLSTVRRADNIVVLELGKIFEQGTHDALLAKNGAYARLWEIQADAIPAA